MKSTTKSLLLLGGLVAATSLTAQAQQQGVTITAVTAMAPNAYGSPSWTGWYENGIYALENGLTSYGVAGPTQFNLDTAALPIVDNIVTGYASWMGSAPAAAPYDAEEGARASFGAIINGNGAPINIVNMGFSASSTDSGDGLGYAYGAGTWTGYSDRAVGIVFNNGIDMSAGYTTVTSGDQDVNEIIYLGTGNAYASYTAGEGGDDPNLGDSNQQILDYDAASISAYTDGSYDLTGTFSYGAATGSATAVFAPDAASTMSLLAVGFGALAGLRRRVNRA